MHLLPKHSTRASHTKFSVTRYEGQHGFTLIELMVVIALIGIMASLAIPPYQNWVQASKVENAVKLTESLQPYVNQYYQQTQSFPANNLVASLPPPNKLLSPEVAGIEVENGAFQIYLSQAVNAQLDAAVVSVRPVYVAGSPKSPISWICGNAAVPAGMRAAGENKTTVPYTMLPISCRDLTGNIARQQAAAQAEPTAN